jgi:hypothetical protein
MCQALSTGENEDAKLGKGKIMKSFKCIELYPGDSVQLPKEFEVGVSYLFSHMNHGNQEFARNTCVPGRPMEGELE